MGKTLTEYFLLFTERSLFVLGMYIYVPVSMHVTLYYHN